MNNDKADSKLIEKSQAQIWSLYVEMSGFSALFRNLEKSDFSSVEYYGISLMLKRISRRLQKISEQLEKIQN